MADAGGIGFSNSRGNSSNFNQFQTRTDVPDFIAPFIHGSNIAATNAISGATNAAGGDLVANLNRDQLTGINLTRDLAQGAGGFIPTTQQELLSTAQGRDLDFLASSLPGFASGDRANPELDALRQTASGNFLFGGDGFNAAVDAAVRAAQPGILSTFGRAGAGGATSGLAQESLGRAAIDAFASQFANERANQLNAATSLGQFDEAAQNRAFQASGLLSQFGSQERDRQLDAVNRLPQAGLLNANLFQDIGGQLQNQQQQELTGGFNANLQLLQAALSGLPISQLLGTSGETASDSTASERQRGLNLGFG